MKKLVCILLAVLLTGSLAGCRTTSEDAVGAVEDVTEVVVTKSFIGTVVDETDTYMYVEPDEGEEERKLSDTIGVFYTTIHADYLYGVGRRVVVYYESDAINEKHEIVSGDISTEGFRDFELVIKDNGTKKFEKVLIADDEKDNWFSNINVSLYGIDVDVIVDGKTVSLKEALEKSYITPQAITVTANRDAKLNKAELIEYRDGGSREYVYKDFKIIKYHTEGGKRDLYIGNLHMKYSG